MESSNVTYISPGIQHGNRLHLTIDNVDFHNNTFDGKNEFQGTSQAVFQKSAIVVPKLIINRTDSLKPSEYTLKIEVKDKLSLQGESFPSFPESLDVDVLQQCKKKGQICYLYQVTEETMAGILPAWSGYSSLASSAQYIRTTFVGLPLYPSPPTDWFSFIPAWK